MQMLGEIRGNFLSRSMVLATKENGYISPLSQDMCQAIGHLEGVEITESFTENDLAEALEKILVRSED